MSEVGQRVQDLLQRLRVLPGDKFPCSHGPIAPPLAWRIPRIPKRALLHRRVAFPGAAGMLSKARQLKRTRAWEQRVYGTNSEVTVRAFSSYPQEIVDGVEQMVHFLRGVIVD